MIVLIWFLNFGVSWLNAWGCGKTWNETKHSGGMPHFMNWMGATMSACGFSWCYMIVLLAVGSAIPTGSGPGEHPLIPASMVEAMASLAYLALIGPILGSGIAITVHAWGVAYRRRSLESGAVAAYDTWAQVYNVQGAIDYVPEATSKVKGFFESDDSDDGRWLIVITLVMAVLAGGLLTTRAIIRSTAKSTAMSRSSFTPAA
jgi:hypothetical protein